MNIDELSKILSKYDINDINIELWKDIIFDYMKYQYQISNYGRIRNKDTGKLIKPYFTFDDNGNKSRSRVFLHTKHGTSLKKFMLYRLVAIHFIENDDPIHKIEVDHLDGNKTNDHFTNLEWVTPEENKRRQNEMGLRPHLYGEKNSVSKWTNEEVDFIAKIIYKVSRDIDFIYSEYIKNFNTEIKTKKQLTNLYYNITSPNKPKWATITDKYK